MSRFPGSLSRSSYIVNCDGQLTFVRPVDGVPGIVTPHLGPKYHTVPGKVTRKGYTFGEKHPHYYADTDEYRMHLSSHGVPIPMIRIVI